MFDIALFIVFGVMAVRVARIVRTESAIFLEFKQSRSIAALVFLFPLGPPVFFLATFRLGWLIAIVLATACYLPGLLVARRRVAAFERAGTDRVHQAKSAASQAFGTALIGLVYVAVQLVFILVRASQPGEFGA
jgi:Ca2+/Na+ antiporter